MINTSRPLQPRPDRPIDPTALLVIGEIHRASQALELPVLLVGAVARIVLLENIFGMRAGRATTDVDFAFALNDWDQFDTLKEHLLKNADFVQAEKIVHRLLFHPPKHEHRYKVDLIPFVTSGCKLIQASD